MKYIIIVPDGAADEPQASLDGKTPLQAANTPACDFLASQGIVGAAWNVPEQLGAGSDVANMSLLGYDPLENFSGRAPLEAAATDIQLGPNDWAVRCNLVTLSDEEKLADKKMKSFSAGHITTEEATALLKTLQEELGDERFEFHPSVAYRNLLILRFTEGETLNLEATTPPHDIIGESVAQYLPSGESKEFFCGIMERSEAILREHPVNLARVAAGKEPATHVWLWSQGKMPQLAPFAELHDGVSGAMITAVDLLRGLAKLIGWSLIEVPGATAYLDTDYTAKGEYAKKALDDYDLVFVHVEAPDEAAHEGSAEEKVRAIERIDEEIILPIYEHCAENFELWRMLVIPDHETLIRTKTHAHGLVPWLIAGYGVPSDTSFNFSEATAKESDHQFPAGHQLMEFFLKGIDVVEGND